MLNKELACTEGEIEGNPQCWCDGFRLKIYIAAKARAEDTQDIVDICNDNGEQSEDEMVIETDALLVAAV